LAERRRVQQVTATSLAEFAKRTQMHADTSLALISDSGFRKGQVAIERSAARERIPIPVMEVIELLVSERCLTRAYGQAALCAIVKRRG